MPGRSVPDTVRPVTRSIVEDDFPFCVDIFTDAWNDLHRRSGFEQEVSEDDSWLLKILAHFGQTDPHGGRIALIDGVPVAFGLSLRREDFWCLSFLFVRPHAQGRGVGRRLLLELLPREGGVVRVCEVESFQMVATALYLSAGMAPCSVRYFLDGPSRPDQGQIHHAELNAVEMSPNDFADIDALDERLLGFRRPEDHRWWLGPMTGIAYRRREELVGYAYVDDGWIAPALAVDEPTLSVIVADVVRTADDPAGVKTSIFGTSRDLFAELLKAGWRIEESKYGFVYSRALALCHRTTSATQPGSRSHAGRR
jgi:GNAT superfamily N-acetyltransferase